MSDNKQKTKNYKPIPCKIILVGDSGVGKTCIIRRYLSSEFFPNNLTTDGVSYSKKDIIKDGKVIQLDLWDTAGQEKYRSLGKHFYKDAFIIILVYDITKKESFENMKNIWLEDIINFGEKYKVLAVVGNKCDLYEQEAIPEEEARKFADEHNALFVNVSAKVGTNIDFLFESCVKKYFDQNFQMEIMDIKKKDEDSIIIGRRKRKKSHTKKKCC